MSTSDKDELSQRLDENKLTQDELNILTAQEADKEFQEEVLAYFVVRSNKWCAWQSSYSYDC